MSEYSPSPAFLAVLALSDEVACANEGRVSAGTKASTASAMGAWNLLGGRELGCCRSFICCRFSIAWSFLIEPVEVRRFIRRFIHGLVEYMPRPRTRANKRSGAEASIKRDDGQSSGPPSVRGSHD